jgi:hypothetical protein
MAKAHTPLERPLNRKRRSPDGGTGLLRFLSPSRWPDNTLRFDVNSGVQPFTNRYIGCFVAGTHTPFDLS